MQTRQGKMVSKICLLFFYMGIGQHKGAVIANIQGQEFYESNYPGHGLRRTSLGDSIDVASAKLLKVAYDESTNKNVISSPLGVLMLLSMYATGARGAIVQEITSFLNASNSGELFDNYSQLSEEYSNFDHDLLTLVNKVYVSENLTIDPQFSDNVQRFRSSVETISFKDGEAAADIINAWAERESNGHIRNAVSKDILDEHVAAALFNVIYFQGHWNIPFDVSETVDEPFYLDRTTSTAKPMMRLLRSLFYHDSSSLNAKLVELPYKEGGFRMVVVLPNEVDGLPSLLSKVSESGLLSEVFSLRPQNVEIDLHMPKFTIDTELNLKNLLPKIGLSKIFTDSASEIVKEASVVVSEAFQKAFIKVDEEGATAGAFTGFILIPDSLDSTPPTPIQVRVDHPFLFTILKEDKVLFIGTYTH